MRGLLVMTCMVTLPVVVPRSTTRQASAYSASHRSPLPRIRSCGVMKGGTRCLLRGYPSCRVVVLASPDALWLNDPINGYRAIRAGLGRGVEHGTRILMKYLTVDCDGAAVSFRRGAENLTVRDRRVLAA